MCREEEGESAAKSGRKRNGKEKRKGVSGGEWNGKSKRI